MAKVIGPFKLRGSLGDLSFCINEFGAYVKEKGGPSPEQVKVHARFANTRRNAAEWKKATAASRLLRVVMGGLLDSVKNMRLSSRMNGVLLAALKADPVHQLGKRLVSAGDLSVLSGFEFNHNLLLDDALPFNIEHCYAVEADKVVLQVPAFRLRKKKKQPAGATHFRLVSCLLTVDFDKRKYTRDKRESEVHKMGNKAGTAFEIEHLIETSIAPGSLWLMGVEFFKLVEERPVLVRGGALRIMKVVTTSNLYF